MAEQKVVLTIEYRDVLCKIIATGCVFERTGLYGGVVRIEDIQEITTTSWTPKLIWETQRITREELGREYL